MIRLESKTRTGKKHTKVYSLNQTKFYPIYVSYRFRKSLIKCLNSPSVSFEQFLSSALNRPQSASDCDAQSSISSNVVSNSSMKSIVLNLWGM